MKFDNKIPIAVEAHSKLNLPFDHVSSGAFMLLQPLYYRHSLKTENNRFNFISNVRPNPIVVPTFGRIRQNLRHFFVPYRLVFPNWEESINDVIASNFEHSSQVVGVPQFSPNEVLTLFFTGNYGFSVVEPEPQTLSNGTPINYDFLYQGVGYKLTRLGRNCYKVFYSLGYDILPSAKDFKWNALALLAYARVYCDWYANSAYLNDQIYLSLVRYFKYNDPSAPLVLTASDLYNILLFVRPAVYNTNNYFEDAWDNPVSPNSNQFTSFTFTDPTMNNGARIVTDANGTPEMTVLVRPDFNTTLGTQYIHDALKKLNNYQKRHALAGARAIDRVLAEYGIQTDYLRLQRSIYVGVSQFDVDINSIYATANGSANGESSVVGDYAGAGFGAGQNQIAFQNDEEGIFISVSTLQPSGGYYQGYDRNNRHLTKEQFYNAAFDALGVQSIEKGEVYVSRNLDTFAADAGDYSGHFGFTGRYAEYKRSISRVSGDLSLPSVIAGGHAWHLMREFNDAYFNNSVSNISHSQDFCRGTDAEQYMRLFTYTNYDIDPFNLFLHVDVVSYAPCHPMNDYDFGSDAPQVAINSNGPKVN